MFVAIQEDGHLQPCKTMEVSALQMPTENAMCMQDGSTALHLASWKGKTDVVKLLVNRGANYRVRPWTDSGTL